MTAHDRPWQCSTTRHSSGRPIFPWEHYLRRSRGLGESQNLSNRSGVLAGYCSTLWARVRDLS
ncbi:hypothetical protein M6B38_299535 [Iris pallida]|uniref:Uncharacterized protein n=1 Tax=Iris pallida TaxID=29817 RepID=A0AAX6HQ83_IRIPA|nr:hypothetical protein M6B38_246190 [Iris pallida]KAJ6825161.1 hypothetical protein M6B38_378850 [Iris pallida]KAJ6842978.1 hypothetical protein M6B38_299535 [Iris pallida]